MSDEGIVVKKEKQHRIKKEKKQNTIKQTDKKRKGFSNRKLATKIASVIAVTLIVLLGILMSVVLLTVKDSVGDGITGQLSTMAKSNAEQVQNIISVASSSAESLQNYVTDAYEKSNQEKLLGEVDTDFHTSEVYGVKISEKSADVESFILGTARSTVENSADIQAMGVLFEPYAFDDYIRSFDVYISNEDVDTGNIQHLGANYEEYSKEEYYKSAAATKKAFFTEPYEFQGNKMITASYPIIYNGTVKGVVVVDILVSNFSKLNEKIDKFPSLYTTIFSGNKNIVYDSEDEINVGKNMADFYKNSEELEQVESLMQQGEAFEITADREDGSQVAKFYYPITAGEDTWWSLTAIDVADMNKSVTIITRILFVLSIIILAVILGVTTYVLRKMLSPINTVVTAARSISSGDFNISLKAESHDEIGELTETFDVTAQTLRGVIKDITSVLGDISQKNLNVDVNGQYNGDLKEIKDAMYLIINGLNQVIGNINEISDQVASGSDQVASGAQALSQGATEQASSVEELAATITDISKQVKENAESAAQASKKTQMAGEFVVKSNDQMQNMKNAMEDITQKSGEIEKIIKTIEDIAFQTNILALNAAVEAARAGDAGKGFAVVADEVRNLASKSAEAAANTTVLIEGSLQAVANGTELAENAAESMAEVVAMVEDIVETVDKITEASETQAVSIEQVTQGIDQISSVVQTNSATAEESAAASQELSGQAQVLKELVNQFKLKE